MKSVNFVLISRHCERPFSSSRHCERPFSSSRHCEERLRRSNPVRHKSSGLPRSRWSLAMTFLVSVFFFMGLAVAMEGVKEEVPFRQPKKFELIFGERRCSGWVYDAETKEEVGVFSRNINPYVFYEIISLKEDKKVTGKDYLYDSRDRILYDPNKTDSGDLFFFS